MVSAARRRIVFNAIKSAILKGAEVEYWALRMYDQQAAGVLNDEQVSELEALLDDYYEEPAQEPAEPEAEPVEGEAEPETAPEAPEEAE